MKIKGKATITLRDVHTGAEKVLVHENEITEFAAEYFRECGALNWNPLGSLPTQGYTLDDLFGGIMLFKLPIISNSADYPSRKPLYCPAGNTMVGNATIDNQANSGQGVTELGQYNEGESSADEEQRTYVYDWDTNEANGEISTICLTTRAGGYIGAGNATSGKADVQLLQRRFTAYPGYVTNTRTIDSDTQSRLCALSIGDAQVATLETTAASALTNGEAKINWYDTPISKLNPFEDTRTFVDYKTVSGVKIMKTPRRSETHTFTAFTGITEARVMGGTGYILIVGANSSSIQNGTTVKAIQFNKDGTTETFSATIAGMNGYINLPANIYGLPFIGGKIINGALYLAGGPFSGSDNTRRVKIAANGAATNLTYTNDRERVFDCQEGRIYIGGYDLTNNTSAKYYDTSSGTIYHTNGTSWQSSPADAYTAGLWNCYDSPCLFCCGGKINSTTYVPYISTLSILRPFCNWLSTINVLPNTITKTDTQTMKIRYQLTLYRAPNT